MAPNLRAPRNESSDRASPGRCPRRRCPGSKPRQKQSNTTSRSHPTRSAFTSRPSSCSRRSRAPRRRWRRWGGAARRCRPPDVPALHRELLEGPQAVASVDADTHGDLLLLRRLGRLGRRVDRRGRGRRRRLHEDAAVPGRRRLVGEDRRRDGGERETRGEEESELHGQIGPVAAEPPLEEVELTAPELDEEDAGTKMPDDDVVDDVELELSAT